MSKIFFNQSHKKVYAKFDECLNAIEHLRPEGTSFVLMIVSKDCDYAVASKGVAGDFAVKAALKCLGRVNHEPQPHLKKSEEPAV